MNEEFFGQVNQLTMHQPSIDLMVENFVADEENAGKHVLDNRISTDAPLIKCV